MEKNKLWKKVSKMDLGNPVIIGSSSGPGHILYWTKDIFRWHEVNGKYGTSTLVHRVNIIYMFIGGIVMTLLNHHHYLLLRLSHL